MKSDVYNHPQSHRRTINLDDKGDWGDKGDRLLVLRVVGVVLGSGRAGRVVDTKGLVRIDLARDKWGTMAGGTGARDNGGKRDTQGNGHAQ